MQSPCFQVSQVGNLQTSCYANAYIHTHASSTGHMNASFAGPVRSGVTHPPHRLGYRERMAPSSAHSLTWLMTLPCSNPSILPSRGCWKLVVTDSQRKCWKDHLPRILLWIWNVTKVCFIWFIFQNNDKALINIWPHGTTSMEHDNSMLLLVWCPQSYPLLHELTELIFCLP